MKFNFDWNYVAAGAPYITISESGLGFNSPAIALLENPEDVIVGFDKENMTIGIMAYDGKENVKTYKFYSRIKNGWVRIGCKEFVKYLSELSGVQFSPAKRFIAMFDEDEKLLYITINAENAESDEEKEE